MDKTKRRLQSKRIWSRTKLELEREDFFQEHKVFSLITGFGSWTTEKVGEEKAEIELKLTELAEICRIEIANECESP